MRSEVSNDALEWPLRERVRHIDYHIVNMHLTNICSEVRLSSDIERACTSLDRQGLQAQEARQGLMKSGFAATA
jgi:hypothetical protein